MSGIKRFFINKLLFHPSVSVTFGGEASAGCRWIARVVSLLKRENGNEMF